MVLDIEAVPVDMGDLKARVKSELQQRVWLAQCSQPNALLKKLVA
jgi:hypothetical protein